MVTTKAQLPELNEQQSSIVKEIEEVKALSGNKPDKTQMGFLLNLARNYYLLDQYQEAEKYYLQVIDQDICGSLDYKALAICLRQNGKTQLANDLFATYRGDKPSDGINELWSHTDTLPNHMKWRETRLTNYDFIYGSLTSEGTSHLNIDHGTATGNIGCNSIVNMTAINWPVEEFTHIGSFTAGPAPNSYFFSYKDETGYYNIYYITRKKDTWAKPKKVILAEDGFNYAYPFYSNGFLFFSSDRTGGFGQFDLYRAQWTGKTANGVMNLGQAINSDKNEILPSIINGQLSYSSNGLPGQGGYDIYYISSDLKTVTPLLVPYNSSSNDLLLVDSKESSAAVIRENKGRSNIYLVETYADYTRMIEGYASDENGQIIPEVRILISPKTNQGQYVTTSLEGTFTALVIDTIDVWQVEAWKSGYVTKRFDLSLSTLGDNPLVVPMEYIEPVEPEPVFIVNSPSHNVIPAAPEIETQDSTTPIDTLAAQPKDDIFNEVNSDGQYYIVYASSRSYKGAYTFWEEWSATFPESEILHNEKKGVYRVGTYAGKTKSEAMTAYRKARNIKQDVWILRPDQQ
ncbi:MAG: tetratricopeptide repeat protein [Bacteroidia bacterium]|nr:tetratricopeptide repeat protein [Bacteroidia bacterium]